MHYPVLEFNTEFRFGRCSASVGIPGMHWLQSLNYLALSRAVTKQTGTVKVMHLEIASIDLLEHFMISYVYTVRDLLQRFL